MYKLPARHDFLYLSHAAIPPASTGLLFYIEPFTLCQPSSLQIKESEKIKDLGIFGKLLRTNWFLYRRKIIFQH